VSDAIDGDGLAREIVDRDQRIEIVSADIEDRQVVREIVSVDPDDRRVPLEEFGPYLIYELLGQGGMATVHRAEKRGVGIRRPIALKRLLPHGADDPDLVKLFVDEARLASYLHHANVAQIYELGQVGETYFIAMEYASGPTLSQIVRQCQKAAGPIPIAITVNLLTQVCDALDYAHHCCDETGVPLRIIHRDVSPGNIVVTNAGVVKLIDFGIAKATISSVQTQVGFIKGKFGYIAPEYITGKIDARVDLFAVGVIAHELLAGRRLFEGDDDFQTLSNIREMVIQPPSTVNPHVTRDLDDIVMTALARNPAKRWQSAGAMRVALANLSRALGVVVGPPQVFEWVQWAFSQVPRDSQPALRAANASDTDLHLLLGPARRESSLSIQLTMGPTDADAFATPREPFQAVPPGEIAAIERVEPESPVRSPRVRPPTASPRPRPVSPPPPPLRTRAPSPQPSQSLTYQAIDPLAYDRPDVGPAPAPAGSPVSVPVPPAPLWLSPSDPALAMVSARAPRPPTTDEAEPLPAPPVPPLAPLWLSPSDAAVALPPDRGRWPSPADDDGAATPVPVLRTPPVELRTPPAGQPVRPEDEPWPAHSSEPRPAAAAPLWLSRSDAAVTVAPEREPWPAHGAEPDPGATLAAPAAPRWLPPVDPVVAAAVQPTWSPGAGPSPWQRPGDEAAEPLPSHTLRAAVPPLPPSRPLEALSLSGLFDEMAPEPALPRRTEAVPATEKIKPLSRPMPDAVRPIAPRPSRRRLWLLLLMIALGAAAMATAYFWPTGV
jgi:serine/threonine protein kinase